MNETTTLDDYQGKQWGELDGDQRRRAVLLIWGWSIFVHKDWFEDADGNETLPAYVLVPPKSLPWADEFDSEFWRTEQEAWEEIGNPLEGSSAWDLFKAKAREYGLGNGYDMPHYPDGPYCMYKKFREQGYEYIVADTPELAICEACFCAWKAREGKQLKGLSTT